MKKASDGETLDKAHAARNSAIGLVLGMLLGGLVDSFTGDYGLATVAGMILGALAGYRSAAPLDLMEYPPRVIRYLALAGVLFFASLLAAFYLIDQQRTGSFSMAIALFPSLLGALFVLTLGYAISTLDELQRRIQLETIAVGFGITAVIALTVGMLRLAGVPQPDWILLAPIMAVAWLVGKLWTRWRYR